MYWVSYFDMEKIRKVNWTKEDEYTLIEAIQAEIY